MLLPPLILLSFLAALGFALMQVEVQVMGLQPWAVALPVTWRVEQHWALDWFCAGRPLTAYHAWLAGFLALAVHLPPALLGAWTLTLEARVLGSLLLTWLARDVWWFAMHAGGGSSVLEPARAPWIRHWFLGMPTDWWLLAAVGGALLWWSYRLHIATTTKPVASGET
jgi:hypothetical protein